MTIPSTAHSEIEKIFIQSDPLFDDNRTLRRIPVITVDNYVELGRLTALRFLEWVCHNPGGVVALPTGRTPEFFIKWMQHYLQHWTRESSSGILARAGLSGKKPDFASLHFFQLDEFFPINPAHERSFTHFVKKYYLDAFGFDPAKTRLINTWVLSDAQKAVLGNFNTLDEIFPDGDIDLNLRIKKPVAEQEIRKLKAIRLFDQFCAEYEAEIRSLGGIGFFLGGIGPDGHIAFNVRGSSHFSHTRLTGINYETQATAASDLGGIELVRKKAVITIGLETITFNPDTVALIIAAGQSKSTVVANAVQHPPSLEYPASALQKLPNARFYVTKSAGSELDLTPASIRNSFTAGETGEAFVEKCITDAALALKTPLMQLAQAELNSKERENLHLVQSLSGKDLRILSEQVVQHIHEKISKGLKIADNQKIIHTAPHHDDIELAYFPLLHHLVRSEHSRNYFVYCTSGFTAVTNTYLLSCLNHLSGHIRNGNLQSGSDIGHLFSIRYAQDDITGYLNGITRQSPDQQTYFVSTRLARNIGHSLGLNSLEALKQFVDSHIDLIRGIEAGRREPEIIHRLKGWLREFEAELVWAHFGIDMDQVFHLRLPFYSDDIFPRYPDHEKDVIPILNLFEQIRPTVITVALDPEGSGPDTHYKTLIAVAEAIDHYVGAHPDIHLRIWGYRNIWTRFKIHEVNSIIPLSLNSFAVLHNMFNTCFLSQKSASFPSYEYDGTFSELAQKIWVEQHQDLIGLLGKDYFYSSPNPMMRRSYGAIYMKDMSYPEFTEVMVPVRRLLDSKKAMK